MNQRDHDCGPGSHGPAIPSPLDAAPVTGKDLHRVYDKIDALGKDLSAKMEAMQQSNVEFKTSVGKTLERLEEVLRAHDDTIESTDHNNPGLLKQVARLQERYKFLVKVFWLISIAATIIACTASTIHWVKEDGLFGQGGHSEQRSKASQPAASSHARAEKQ